MHISLFLFQVIGSTNHTWYCYSRHVCMLSQSLNCIIAISSYTYIYITYDVFPHLQGVSVKRCHLIILIFYICLQFKPVPSLDKCPGLLFSDVIFQVRGVDFHIHQVNITYSCHMYIEGISSLLRLFFTKIKYGFKGDKRRNVSM